MRLSRHIYKHLPPYLFATACMVIQTLLDMAYPLITAKIVDDVIVGGQMQILPRLLAAILVVGIGLAFGGYFKEYTFDLVSIKIGTNLRKDLFAHIQSLSMDYFDKTNTGELMARVKDDVDHIWMGLGFIGMLCIQVVIHVGIVLYCMFRLDWRLAILPAVIMAILGTLAVYMERKMDVLYEEISEENAVLTTIAEENLSGVRTVKAFARESFEINKFRKHNQKYYELNVKQSKIMVRFHPFFELAGKLLPVIILILGGYTTMTLGTLVAFAEYCRNIVWPMEILGWITNEFSAAVASYRKIQKIFKERSSIREPERPAKTLKVQGDVSFEHVSYGKEGKPILRDISFRIPSGKTLGIMGSVGSGKTTIINLLLRFIDPDAGSVKLDGVDVKELSFQQLRGNISMVMQDVFLFSDTVDENIRMGQKDFLEREHVERAAVLAQAEVFIGNLEEEYETVIGERGVGLSGGQKQRIGIARALSKGSPILVFDDATSALDMETEHQIQKTLENLTDTTKIIIGHRISAVRAADEILVLEQGEVKERGNHDALMEQKGLYYQTWQVQYGGFK